MTADGIHRLTRDRILHLNQLLDAIDELKDDASRSQSSPAMPNRPRRR